MWVWDRPQVEALAARCSPPGRTAWRTVRLGRRLAAHLRPHLVRSLRAQTSAAGIRVHALGSETSWIDDVPAALSGTVALGTGLFDGVRPQRRAVAACRGVVRPKKTALLGRYLDLLDADGGGHPLRWRPRSALLARPGHRPRGAARRGGAGPGRRGHRDPLPRDCHRAGQHHRDRCRRPRRGCPGRQAVRLAVETNYLGSDPVSRKQTFWGSTQAQLATALAAVDAAEAGSASYAGIVVHDRAGWAGVEAPMTAALPLSTDATPRAWEVFLHRYGTRRSGAADALRAVIAADPGLAVARAAARCWRVSRGRTRRRARSLPPVAGPRHTTGTVARRGDDDPDQPGHVAVAAVLGASPPPVPGRPARVRAGRSSSR